MATIIMQKMTTRYHFNVICRVVKHRINGAAHGRRRNHKLQMGVRLMYLIKATMDFFLIPLFCFILFYFVLFYVPYEHQVAKC